MFASTQDPEFVQGQSRDVPNRELGPNSNTRLPPLSRGSIPGTASSGKAGSCLPLVGSLQYRTLTNCMYWFPLPFQLPVVI